MRQNKQNDRPKTKAAFILRAALLASVALPLGATAWAQEVPAEIEEEARQDVVVVQGIRGSLQNALNEKRNSDNLVEVILAEDIGKLPDQNLAEVLENVTGVQITRTAGVGTGVQIRGTDANRTEINGVSTVGSGAGRSGINFEDVSAGIIAGVEVTKAPDAKTIEGSVGGTVNLRTIRPLDLDGPLLNARVQGEDSSLTTDGITPRLSGAIGNKWENAAGQEIGFVLSGSYSEQDVTAFRPRADRDRLVPSDSGFDSAESFDFLTIQFLNQDYDNFEYETLNIAGSLEASPTNNTKFFMDVIYNDQDSQQESSRVQASGVGNTGVRSVIDVDSFETVDFGTLPGENGAQNLGSIQAALTGVLGINLGDDDDDPNLRLSSDTNSRITESFVARAGFDWDITDRLSSSFEVASSTSDSTTPFFNTTLNFINPNVPLDPGGSNDNTVPFEFDLSDGLSFGIANVDGAPTSAQLLDASNYVLRDVNIGQDTAKNQENAFRADFSYDLADSEFVGDFLTSVDFGYRHNETSSLRDQVRRNLGLRNLGDSPRGDLFASLLTAGPNNFGDSDGRRLFVSDFLLVNPELVASNPGLALQTLSDAIDAHGGSRPLNEPTSSQNAFFDIKESTDALYAQANFEYGIVRGNAGVRYLETDISSVGNTILPGGGVERVSTSSSYDFVLPRFNLVATPREDVLLRFGYSTDIRRPNFDNLSTSRTFSTSPNTPVTIGNPALEPEQVDSFDVSAEWYFAPSAVISIGYFNKKRNDLIVRQQEDPFEAAGTGFRDLTDPCEGGGIFNPIADVNVFGPATAPPGVCVPALTFVNDDGETTQEGIEVAFQYDLSDWEDEMGSFAWASGFGVLANYTNQSFSGGNTVNTGTSRAQEVFAALGATDTVTFQQPLINLSENAYNATLYYEKYGLSARARYTWRDAYRSTDFGSTSSFPWGFPVVQDARGQLNASVNYDINENFSIGAEAVNLTESEVKQFCVNEGSLLCFQGLTDRRITFGASYTY